MESFIDDFLYFFVRVLSSAIAILIAIFPLLPYDMTNVLWWLLLEFITIPLGFAVGIKLCEKLEDILNIY